MPRRSRRPLRSIASGFVLAEAERLGHEVAGEEGARGQDDELFGQLEHRVINVRDEPEEDMLAHLDEALTIVRDARAAGRQLLIHCFAGVSRSATVAIAHLMTEAKRGGDARPRLDAAFRQVISARPRVDPNPGFIRQLMAFEALGCPEPLPAKHEYQPLVDAADLNSLDIGWSEAAATASVAARAAEEQSALGDVICAESGA